MQTKSRGFSATQQTTLEELQAEMGAAEDKPVAKPGTTVEALAALSVATKAFGSAVLQGLSPALQAAVIAVEKFMTEAKAIEGAEQWQRNKARYERRYARHKD